MYTAKCAIIHVIWAIDTYLGQHIQPIETCLPQRIFDTIAQQAFEDHQYVMYPGLKAYRVKCVFE